MTLRIDKISALEGQEARYAVCIEHNGHIAQIEVSAIQVAKRFPELFEEINIKEQILQEKRMKSNIAIPGMHIGKS